MAHILVVEDEESLARGIKFNLEAEGYQVTHSPDGMSALEFLNHPDSCVDLVVLDLMMPGMSGYRVCETLREQGMEMPVLMLSARTLAEDRTRGFDVGADQYLTKPFELDELLSRINGLLTRYRRTARSTAQPLPPKSRGASYQFADVTVDFQTLQVTKGDVTHQLTALEMKLLEYFIRNEGRVIPRRELLEHVWERTGRLATRAPDQFIRRLRKMIEIEPSEPQFLLTIRDAGYRFVSTPDE